MCDEASLKLGEDSIPPLLVINCLQRIGNKAIIYKNYFPISKQVLLLKIQVKYIENKTVTRDTANLGF